MTSKKQRYVGVKVVATGLAAGVVWFMGHVATKQVLAENGDCKSVMVIYARGSGQPLGADEERLFREGVASYVSHSTQVGYVELGPSLIGTQGTYPAVGVAGLPSGDPRIWAPQAVNAVGATLTVSWLQVGQYKSSLDAGREVLFEFLRSPINKRFICNTTQFVLAGYSQGAQVIGDALGDARMRPYDDAIISVQLFGDPTLNYKETGDVAVGAWYRGTAASESYGILGKRLPYLPRALQQKVGSWCRDRDGICTHSLYFDEHSKYRQREIIRGAKEAGEAIALSLRRQRVLPDRNCAPEKLDVVLVLDTGEAMRRSGFYEQDVLRSEATNLSMSACDVRIAAVGFSEVGQAPRVLLDFTNSIDVFVDTLAKLRDGSTGYATLQQTDLRQGLLTAARLPWREDAQRVVLAHVKSQSTGWHATEAAANVNDELAKLAYQDSDETKRVAKSFAEYNIGFRFAIATFTTVNTRAYQGGEAGPLDALSAILGGQPVSYGCTQYCYWRVVGTFAGVPTFRAVPVDAIIDQDFYLRTTDTSNGSIAAATAMSNIVYEWDLDGDGVFELSGTGIANGTEPLRLGRVGNHSGYARVKTLVGQSERGAGYNSYTVPVSITVHQSQDNSVTTPTIDQIVSRRVDTNTALVTWRRTEKATTSPLSYVVRTAAGDMLAVTPTPAIQITDLPSEDVELAVATLDESGKESLPVKAVLTGNHRVEFNFTPALNTGSTSLAAQHVTHPPQTGFGASRPAAIVRVQPSIKSMNALTQKASAEQSRSPRAIWFWLALVLAIIVGISSLCFVTIKRCKRHPAQPPP